MKYICALLLLINCSLAFARQPTSIIFVIADGMAPAYTSAYRYYADDPATAGIETTIFDELLVGMARTYPRDSTLVTDSAASATALASGVKTYNGAIGVDINQQPLVSILETAKLRRYQTALVATSAINHATPASFVAHVNNRQSYDAIADQYLDQRIQGKPKVDLLLGGGRKYFRRKDRDLVQEFVQEGYRYIGSMDQLDSLTRLPALGLFADDGLVSALDSPHPLALTEMTTKALQLLKGKPFFLLIEASQIDWCGHANDIACAMAEMNDLAQTLKVAKGYVDQHPNTVLVATADHGTGGLSLGAGNHYEWRVGAIKQIQATAGEIAERLMTNPAHWQTEWLRLTQLTLTPSQSAGMQQLMDKTRELNETHAPANLREIVKNGVLTLTLALINEHTHTGWTTHGHTGEDVQIFSYGKRSQAFAGNLNNTDIAQGLFDYLPRR